MQCSKLANKQACMIQYRIGMLLKPWDRSLNLGTGCRERQRETDRPCKGRPDTPTEPNRLLLATTWMLLLATTWMPMRFRYWSQPGL